MAMRKEVKRETTINETTIETFTENDSLNNSQDDIKSLLNECQSFHYTQSSSFSKLARTIILGVIGTIWIVSYSIDGFAIANLWLLWSLIVGFIYLILDVCHYFFDSCFYRKEYFKFEEEKSVFKHDKRMSDRSLLSYYAIWAKFIVLIATCFLFIMGFINQYNFI